MNEGPAVAVSGSSPIAGCEGDQVGSGINFLKSEVEPWMAVNPTDRPDGDGILGDNLIGAWQQDRWDNGGSEGIVTASSRDGGPNVDDQREHEVLDLDRRYGGERRQLRARLGPVGRLLAERDRVPDDPVGRHEPRRLWHPPERHARPAVDRRRATWSDPITLRRDENPADLNDKNTLTADPNDSNFVYAVWDRLAPPSENANPNRFEHAVAGRGPTWFSRTTDGGASWETARLIFEPGTNNQTISNQIVVLPDNAQFDGKLVNVFDLIQGAKNRPPGRGFSIAVIRSGDHGSTWSRRAITVDRHNTFQGLVIDPDDPDPATQLVERATSSRRSRSTRAAGRSTWSSRTFGSARAAASRSRSRSTAG